MKTEFESGRKLYEKAAQGRRDLRWAWPRDPPWEALSVDRQNIWQAGAIETLLYKCMARINEWNGSPVEIV